MARVPKSAFSPDACPQGFHLLHLHLRQGAEDHLRDAHARLDILAEHLLNRKS